MALTRIILPKLFFFVYELETGATVTSCTNSGTVSGGRAAGIVGTLGATPGDEQPDSLLNCTITSCGNSGEITGQKSGGIFGYQISYAKGDADQNIDHMGVVITSCTNTGSPDTLSGSSVAVTIG